MKLCGFFFCFSCLVASNIEDITINASFADYDADLVVAHYNEDISSSFLRIVNSNVFNNYSIRLYIYSKGQPAAAQAWPYGPVHFSTLPNVGRESHTMAHHFYTHYNNLSATTIFVQGGFELFDTWLLPAIRHLNANRQRVQFIGMPKKRKCSCMYGCSFYSSPWMPTLYQVITHKQCLKYELFWTTFRGQFIVKKEIVLRNPPLLYDYFRYLLSQNDSHLVHSSSNYEYVGKSISVASTASNAHLGHAVERLTSVLFDCYRDNVVMERDLMYCHEGNAGSDMAKARHTGEQTLWSVLNSKYISIIPGMHSWSWSCIWNYDL